MAAAVLLTISTACDHNLVSMQCAICAYTHVVRMRTHVCCIRTSVYVHATCLSLRRSAYACVYVHAACARIFFFTHTTAKESIVIKYMKRLCGDGMSYANASRPEVQLFEGQRFGDVDGGTAVLRPGQVLLLGFGHRNSAIRRCAEDPTMSLLDTVKECLEKGLRFVRIWNKELPQDVGEFISEEGNSGHDGATDGFPQFSRLMVYRIDPAFEQFKRALEFEDEETEALVAEANVARGNKYYAVLRKFVQPKWGDLFLNQTAFTEMRRINRRLKEWNVFEDVMDDAAKYGNFSQGRMNQPYIVKAMLLLTQEIEDEFAHTLPPHELKICARTWLRFCYENSPSPDGSYDMSSSFVIDTSAKSALAVSVMSAPMTTSKVYRSGEQKAVKNFTPEPKKKPESSAGPADQVAPPKKVTKGDKAQAARGKNKMHCVAPSESMTLKVHGAKGERDKRYAEDLLTATNASTGPDCEVPVDEMLPHQLNVNLLWIDWALTLAHQPSAVFTWQDREYSNSWMRIRKDGKLDTARHLQSTIVKESADAAHDSIMEALESNDAPGNEHTAAWEDHLSDASTSLKLLRFATAAPSDVDFESTPIFTKINSSIAQELNVDQILPEL